MSQAKNSLAFSLDEKFHYVLCDVVYIYIVDLSSKHRCVPARNCTSLRLQLPDSTE